jgi:hypothetical protein
VYSSIIKELGTNDGVSIPCDTNINISFQIEDVTLTLTPDMYLDRDMEQVTGKYRVTQKNFNTQKK